VGEDELKILLDECAPRIVKKRLTRFSIRMVQALGWTGINNGKLLSLAAGRFDVSVSTDRDLPFQQNLSGKKIPLP
jgi:hypothetical protein